MIRSILSLLLLSALLFSCEKYHTDKYIDVQVDNNATNENIFITGTVNGNLWHAQNNKNSCKQFTSFFTSHDVFNDIITIDYSAYFSQGTTPQPITTPLVGSILITMKNCRYDYSSYQNSDYLFKQTFMEGQQSYYFQGSGSPGIEVEYYDANNNEWSTRYGSQAGSTFNFLSVIDSFSNGKQEKYCEGTYNCKVYNYNNPSQYKTITGGSFSVRYEKKY